MNKPTYYTHSIFDINVEKFKDLKIDYLLIDFDNTLLPYKDKYLNDKAYKFLNEIKNIDIEPIIISNNSTKRIKTALQNYEMLFLSRAHKPLKFKVLKFLKRHKIEKNKCLMIGDQIYSDIMVANKMHIESILVDPIMKDDLFITKIKRGFDKIARKKMKNIERF